LITISNSKQQNLVTRKRFGQGCAAQNTKISPYGIKKNLKIIKRTALKLLNLEGIPFSF